MEVWLSKCISMYHLENIFLVGSHIFQFPTYLGDCHNLTNDYCDGSKSINSRFLWQRTPIIPFNIWDDKAVLFGSCTCWSSLPDFVFREALLFWVVLGCFEIPGVGIVSRYPSMSEVEPSKHMVWQLFSCLPNCNVWIRCFSGTEIFHVYWSWEVHWFYSGGSSKPWDDSPRRETVISRRGWKAKNFRAVKQCEDDPVNIQ